MSKHTQGTTELQTRTRFAFVRYVGLTINACCLPPRPNALRYQHSTRNSKSSCNMKSQVPSEECSSTTQTCLTVTTSTQPSKSPALHTSARTPHSHSTATSDPYEDGLSSADTDSSEVSFGVYYAFRFVVPVVMCACLPILNVDGWLDRFMGWNASYAFCTALTLAGGASTLNCKKANIVSPFGAPGLSLRRAYNAHMLASYSMLVRDSSVSRVA